MYKVRKDFGVREERLTFCQELPRLLFRYALDLFKNPTWSVGNRLDSVEPAINNQLDVAFSETAYALYTDTSKLLTDAWRKLNNVAIGTRSNGSPQEPAVASEPQVLSCLPQHFGRRRTPPSGSSSRVFEG